MKVYVVINNDRHYDTDVTVFSDSDTAEKSAREVAAAGSRGHGYKESRIPGWLFYANYSPEGDSVWVVEKEIQ